MSGERRGFFRDMLAGLKRVVDELDPSAGDAADAPDAAALRPTFVPPAHVPEVRDLARATRVPRPPGALEEAAFVAACTRCGACLAACPEGTLVAGEDGFPTARLRTHPCTMCRDVPCAAACETGALGAVGPDVGRTPEAFVRFGTVRVLARLCLNHGRVEPPAEPDSADVRADDEDDDPPCERCADWCPVPGALTIAREPGASLVPRVDATRCTGCGLCAAHCAAYPQALIV